MGRPYGAGSTALKILQTRGPVWLRERGGIVVYENHTLDSSHLGDRSFMPQRYVAEDDQLHDAPEELRPGGGLPSLRQQRVDHIKLEEFAGDVERCLQLCFVLEPEKPKKRRPKRGS